MALILDCGSVQVILGTQYAGEMKKGVFTVMHYFMPKRGILSLHSGCNVGANDDVSLFFGLSGARQGSDLGEARARIIAPCLDGYAVPQGSRVSNVLLIQAVA